MNKLLNFIKIILFLSISYAFAQQDTLWTKRFGGSDFDYSFSVQQTLDGGFIITGYTYSYGVGRNDVWLIKTDSKGDTIWTKTFGGIDYDEGWSVQQTSDMGYIITGSTYSYGSGLNDLYLVKTDSNGDTLWTKTFGGSNTDMGNSAQQTLDGGYIIVGYTSSINAGDSDVWLIKTDSNGELLWSKNFGGNNVDYGHSVQQTSDEGYIITGRTKSFGSGNSDVFLIKTDSNGDTLWTKSFGGSEWDEGNSVQITTDGGYLIAGYTTSYGSGNSDIWLIKTNSNGGTLWTKTFGGSGWDEGKSVQLTTDGGYIITGSTSYEEGYDSDIWLLRFESPTLINFNNTKLVSNFILDQNYPNPFNSFTAISFYLPSSGHINLAIYNYSGQLIENIVNGKMSAGNHIIKWDASRYSSGLYFYKVSSGQFSTAKKCILIK